MSTEPNATITETGNGWPSNGDLLVDYDSQDVYRLVETSSIHTGDAMRGEANYVYAVVERAAGCDDLPEDELRHDVSWGLMTESEDDEVRS